MALSNNTWREKEITARAQLVEQIDFMDSSPNHFLIKNFGDSPIYVAMTGEPSEKYYDIMIPAGSVKTMARLGACSRIWVYNTSARPARVHVTSFYQEGISATFIVGGATSATASSGGGGGEGGEGTGGVITGFTTSLPTGGNHIGGVSIDNTTSQPVPTTLHGVAETYLASIKNDIAEIKQAQAALESMVSVIKDTAADILEANSSAIGGAYISGVSNVGETNGTTYEQAGKYISYFTNDGADAMKLALYNTSGVIMMTITILAGEALSDIPIKFSKFKVWSEGSACSYRGLILAD